VQGTPVIANSVSVGVADTTDIPVDDDTTTAALSGMFNPPSNNATIGSYYNLNADNLIYVNRYHYETVTITTSPAWTATVATDSSVFPCKYNFVQKHIYEAGGTANSTMNADVQFIRDTVDDLQSIDAFRDPIVTGAQAGGSGISDDAFDTYMNVATDADLASLSTSLTNFRNALTAQGRTGANNANTGKGTSITYANTTWAAFHTELGTFGSNCGKRVAEIDARIGVPTRAGTRSTTRGVPPAIYVSAIPSSNTTNGQVPYGRSLYNNINYLLGKDLNLLGKLIGDVQSLSTQINLVKGDRNKFEMLNGRGKEYNV
jgi:hypothetical protein